MHAPFLSCCELCYGTNRICYDFVLGETWHPKILFSKKMLNSKVPKWSWIPTKAIWHDNQNSNLSHMLLIWSSSFVKLLWPMFRFLSCIHDQDTRPPTNKLLTLTLTVMQKHAFFYPPNNYSIHLSCVSLSKILYAKK
jgi:hypothetical protein